MKHRLALGLNRSVRELEESIGADEWRRWVVYQNLYDLPDGYLVAGQLGALVAGVAGAKASPATFAPYYALPPRPKSARGCHASLIVMANVAKARTQRV